MKLMHFIFRIFNFEFYLLFVYLTFFMIFCSIFYFRIIKMETRLCIYFYYNKNELQNTIGQIINI